MQRRDGGPATLRSSTMSAFGDDLLSWVRANHVQRFAKETDLNFAINARFGGSSKGRRYPTGCYSGTCDVAVPLHGDRFRWVEVKYAQTYFSQTQPARCNYTLFKKYVFSDSPSEHSVRNDIILKLSSLGGDPSVESAGMLVIFLYSDRYPLPGDTLERLNTIAPAPNWSRTRLLSWRNPDHVQDRTWILPVYWEMPGHSRPPETLHQPDT